ncbi:MAG: polysaccharide biosynthesis protein [Ardenticatenaceae bacterium]|nr:polysaccharide biosynthesis protein [Ardenticatenaceae bacterium]MCB9443926.1 polysaccharide biosynthesis protein [Ardenticatenaceae bacterium]
MNIHLESLNIQRQYARRILLDCIMIPAAFYLAILVQHNGSYDTNQLVLLAKYLIPMTAVHITINAISGIYRRLWAFADLRDAWHVLRASAISTLLLWGGNFLFAWFPGLGSGVIIIAGLLNAFFSTGFKYRRVLLPASHKEFLHSIQAAHKNDCAENALIVGTNTIARQIASQFAYNNKPAKINILGFVNDDPEKNGMTINGITVLGTLAQIPELVKTYAIDVIIIAVEEMNHDELWHLISICQETPAQIKVLPTVTDLMSRQYEDPLTLRDLHVEDLLQRRPLQVDSQLCRDLIHDKVVLVTGAAGSIGSELCYQLCRYEPALLLLLDNNETGLFELNLDLNRKSRIPVLLLLADITDRPKIETIFHIYRPHLVFHAAAYKHVPLVEINPDQSLRVNIKGTMIVSEMAHTYGAQRFVFISTDKAVKPKSVMGASKYACEIWLRALDKQSGTIFSIVRFGNVIGSRGSVLPIFARQIEQGGPVTITHKEMKRFFMSIPEAVNLVLQAAAFGQGGEVFMLDMGDEVRIQDLAERMIRLKGLRVHKDIPIEYIGVRPGEKLHEILSYDEEERLPTHHPRIYQLQTNGTLPPLDLFQTAVGKLELFPGKPEGANQLHEGIFCLATQAFDQLVPPTRQPYTAVPNLPDPFSKTPESTFAWRSQNL